MSSDFHQHGPYWWSERRFALKSAKVKVLIVDDYETGAHALADYLSLEDMECRVAHEGAEALATSLAWSPHIILMDISMPVLDGIAAARALRERDVTKHTVIFAFTALQAQEVQRHLIGHEFDGYCQKGQPPDALVTFILSAILP
jgi:CheY-like chemotaxis protein